MMVRSILLRASLLVSLVGTPTLAMLSASPSAGVELRRGVIVDRAATAGYLSAPSGGIEAVDLASGRSLWKTDEAALPLGLMGRLLVTQAEDQQPTTRLRIVVFDVGARGRKVVESTIPLPEDVYALVTDELTRSFRATAERDEAGVLVSWSYKESPIEGMKRGGTVPQRIVTGAAHVDLATGRAVAVAPRSVNADPMAERLMASGALSNVPWRTESVLATTEGGRGGPLTLKRWDARTGAALPDRELLKKAIVALSSADRSHLLASERVGAGGPDDPEYRWSIFSVETGELAGELQRDVSASPFVLSNGNIVFETPPNGFRSGGVWIEEPLKIRAVRLSDGSPLWDREIRDLRYRGPVPPARPEKAVPKAQPQPPMVPRKR